MNENSLVPWCSKLLQYFFDTPINILLSRSGSQKRESCEAPRPAVPRTAWLVARPAGQGRGGAAAAGGALGPAGSWHSDHRRRKRAREEEHVKLSTRSKLLTLRSVSSVALTLGRVVLMRHSDSSGSARRPGTAGPCHSSPFAGPVTAAAAA